jgi:hypothetical protein
MSQAAALKTCLWIATKKFATHIYSRTYHCWHVYWIAHCFLLNRLVRFVCRSIPVLVKFNSAQTLFATNGSIAKIQTQAAKTARRATSVKPRSQTTSSILWFARSSFICWYVLFFVCYQSFSRFGRCLWTLTNLAGSSQSDERGETQKISNAAWRVVVVNFCHKCSLWYQRSVPKSQLFGPQIKCQDIEPDSSYPQHNHWGNKWQPLSWLCFAPVQPSSFFYAGSYVTLRRLALFSARWFSFSYPDISPIPPPFPHPLLSSFIFSIYSFLFLFCRTFSFPSATF